nr:oligopeptide/dipeptide ABC transporter ATP-binding protein [Cohnella abietis]
MKIEKDIIVEVRDLHKSFDEEHRLFSRKKNTLTAVDHVSLQIYRGETLGIVGESGSGKSTLGRLILRLLESTSGDVRFEGQSITDIPERKLGQYRRKMQIVFQDPFSALNPWMTVYELVAEPIRHYGTVAELDLRKQVIALLEKVGLSEADLHKHPHEFSGGQRQRICIARALALQPAFIVCDEPVSALDVSIQSQILNLLHDLQEELRLTYLFISHNLAVVRHVADRVAVMYLGKLVEVGPVEAVFANPSHPYTRSLLSAMLSIDPDVRRERIKLPGDIPNPMNKPSGCRFHTRCEFSTDLCMKLEPELLDRGNEHYVACHMKELVQH